MLNQHLNLLILQLCKDRQSKSPFKQCRLIANLHGKRLDRKTAFCVIDALGMIDRTNGEIGGIARHLAELADLAETRLCQSVAIECSQSPFDRQSAYREAGRLRIVLDDALGGQAKEQAMTGCTPQSNSVSNVNRPQATGRGVAQCAQYHQETMQITMSAIVVVRARGANLGLVVIPLSGGLFLI